MTGPSAPDLKGLLEIDLTKALSDRLVPLDNLRSTTFLENHNPRNLPIAGVLVPIVMRSVGPMLLLTQRATTLTKHAGQIAFPGGRMDAGDVDIVATALREAWEETGITADFVSVVGGLQPVESVTGFLMVPVVALVREGFNAIGNPGEVDDIFEVPLDFVLDATNQVQKSTVIAGVARKFYSIVYGSHDIWGATARILVDLSHKLAGDV